MCKRREITPCTHIFNTFAPCEEQGVNGKRHSECFYYPDTSLSCIPEMSTGPISTYTQAMVAFADLLCPRRFDPHHSPQMSHVYGWEDPVCNTRLGKEQLFLPNIFCLKRNKLSLKSALIVNLRTSMAKFSGVDPLCVLHH